MPKLLEINNLRTHFRTEDGVARAVDGVSFSVDRGETLGVVGESGCGKSVTALSVMGLIPDPPGEVVGGEILFDGDNLLEYSDDKMRELRGNDVSMIFQEPMTSLNPVFTIGNQIDEAIILHQNVGKVEAKKRTIEMLQLVGIPSPEQRHGEYPHQLSGGMRQRVMIAMALSCNPKLLIADEPTTALDVTVQAQILELMNRLQEELGMGMVIITHDLGVIAEVCDRVAVMYAGKVVEYADVDDIFYRPRHPYTIGLLESIPRLGEEVEKLATIEGTVPPPTNWPDGCHFCTRCTYADDLCWNDEPQLVEVETGHSVACWHLDRVKAAQEGLETPADPQE